MFDRSGPGPGIGYVNIDFRNKMLTHDDFCKYILENKNWKDKIFFVFI